MDSNQYGNTTLQTLVEVYNTEYNLYYRKLKKHMFDVKHYEPYNAYQYLEDEIMSDRPISDDIFIVIMDLLFVMLFILYIREIIANR